MLFFHVYILKCRDGSYYTGHTDDIEKRISEHKLGSIPTCYTKTRLPVEVVFTEAFATRVEALDMEQRIKGWSRRKKEALINGDWNLLVQLSNQKK
jgi:putative endonuclease